MTSYDALMSGMEFAWRMTTVLVWPTVALFILVIYRGWITSALSSVTKGARLKRVKAGPVDVELEWNSTLDATGQDVGSVLAGMPQPAIGASVPTSLVDLIDEVNRNPRAGIRRAFDFVLRALAEAYPQLAGVAPHQLSAEMQGLVRRGDLSAGVESSLNELHRLFEISQSDNRADQTQGYEFLMLAEGAIHAILRSAQGGHRDDAQRRFDSAAVGSQWRGRYNNAFPIELRISKRTSDDFEGEMAYPGSGTVTGVRGHVDPTSVDESRFAITWQETEYREKGSRSIEFNGYYKARASSNTMTGAWYYNDSQRVVAEFEMEATSD